MPSPEALLALAERRIGRQLGVYRLESILGVGAVGTVYAGVRPDGERGAVRVLHPHVIALPDADERFLGDAREANRVGHAGAVPVLARGRADGEPFVVMELLDGQSIAVRAAQRGGRVLPADAVRIADAVLEVLEHAHANRIVHGDVQPDNLVLTARGIRLLDFGMASVRRIAAAGGAPAHLPPHASAARLGVPPSAAADVAAVGATLYALVTGDALPAPGAAVALGADVAGEAFSALVRRALAPAPGAAFATAAELRAALAAIELRATSMAPPPAPSKAPPAPPTMPPPPRTVPPGPSTPPPPPPIAVARREPPRAVRPGPEVVARDVASSRAVLTAVARCLTAGSAAIAEAMRFEAEAPALEPGASAEARAAREAARPEAARWLLRAYESAAAAIEAGGGAIVWQVAPRALEIHGQPVWQPHAALERVPARLFASGVRALGVRRGLAPVELGTLLRLLAATAEDDPRVGDDLAGALWEAPLPSVVVDAEDDPLGPLDGDPGDELRAELARDLALLRAWDQAALARHRAQAAGQGAPFAQQHEELVELLTVLPADAHRRAEAEAIFGAQGGGLAVPRDQALHVEDETRKKMAADLEADPVAVIERSAVSAVRVLEREADGWAGAALRGSVDALARVEPLAALGLVHVACDALAVAAAAATDGAPTFEIAVDLEGAAAKDDAPEGEERSALARALVTPAALGRMVTAAAPDVRTARRGPTPAAVLASRVRRLLGRLDATYAPAVLDAFPRAREPLVRVELGRHLARAGGAVVAPIAALLPTVDEGSAIDLLRVLVAIGTRPALDAVGAGAASPHPLVRIEALSHLEGASSDRLRRELDALLADPDAGVRLAALRVIRESQIKAAGPRLALHAQDEALDERPPAERREVLATLAALLPSRAEAICLELVEKGTLLPRAAHEETRELAAAILGELGTAPELERALVAVSERRWRNSERARVAARKAAQRIAERRVAAPDAPAPEGGPR